MRLHFKDNFFNPVSQTKDLKGFENLSKKKCFKYTEYMLANILMKSLMEGQAKC